MKTIGKIALFSFVAISVFMLIEGCKKDKEDPVPAFTMSADTVRLVGGAQGLQFFATCTNNGVTMSDVTITTPQDSLYLYNLNNASYSQNVRIPMQGNNQAYPKRIGTWKFRLVGTSSGGNSFTTDATYAVNN
jgi:hypothetical protein